jgi:hypothetical protein
MIPRRSLLILALVPICFAGDMAFIAHQSPLTQGVSALLLLVYVSCVALSLAEPFRGWRSYRLRSLIPLAACAFAWFGREPAGSYLQAREFAEDLPRFQAIIGGIQAETLPPNGESRSVPISAADRGRILVVFAHRDPEAGLIVEFGTGHGFPVQHSGYIYAASGHLPGDKHFHYRWPYVDEVQPQWFRVSN